MRTRSGEINLLRTNKLLYTMVLLFAISVANASPTVTQQHPILTTELSSQDTPSTIACVTDDITGNVNAELANLGKQLLQPPSSSANLNYNQLNRIKSLPAVPATILMALTGFLCVSLVRDRRAWLTALAGLLCLGQAGIHAVPQLTHHLGRRVHLKQPLAVELGKSYLLENLARPRSEIEGAKYIGLLYHLAGIPDGTMSLLHKQESRQTENKFRPSQSAITRLLSRPIPTINCLAPGAEQFICFSPAFTFDNLPRGPPKLT